MPKAKPKTVATSKIAPWLKTKTTIRVVLPAYNEAPNIGKLLQGIDEAMHDAGYAYEVIVVDDGSRDETTSVVEAYAQHVPLHLERHKVNQGLGATIRDGLRIASEHSADKDIIIAMDADNTHSPGLMRRMVRSIAEGHDVVIASRYQPGAFVKGVPFLRVLLSWGGSFLFRVMFPTHGVRDFTCGYRAYRASLLKEAFARFQDDFIDQDGFQCMVDILLKLRKTGAIFGEVPLILRYDRKEGASKMKVLRTIKKTLALLVRRRFFED